MVTLSTTEAEYIAAGEAGKELVWMRNLLTEFGYTHSSASHLLIDNNSAVTVSKNPEHHGRMKHLNLQAHWLCNNVEAGIIAPIHISTTLQAADFSPNLLNVKRLMFVLIYLVFRRSRDVSH
jgi:hypothetical protein